MSSNEVIDTFVGNVVRRLSVEDASDIGRELRGLLSEMLAEREQSEGRSADDRMVVEMLLDFGTPSQVAARYEVPTAVIIPAEQTKHFARLAIGGVLLQWALTLPAVFRGEPLAGWWIGRGLGALWWPGFLVMVAIVSLYFRNPSNVTVSRLQRLVDPERISRGPWIWGLSAFAISAIFLGVSPWIAASLPEPVATMFAFDSDFLRLRATPIVILLAAAFAVRIAVFSSGRWSRRKRLLDSCISLAVTAVMAWWIVSGPIFQTGSTDQMVKPLLGFVTVLIILDLARVWIRHRKIHDPAVPAS